MECEVWITFRLQKLLKNGGSPVDASKSFVLKGESLA